MGMAELGPDRVVIIVLDSVGVGALPDAAAYGDAGSNTLAHTAEAVGGLNLPNLGRLGLGDLLPLVGVPPADNPLAARGRLGELSLGKDTTSGHWELAGVVLEQAFPTYPQGFPAEVIEPLVARIGRGIMGNKVASGTEIIKELGAEHLATGRPIVYTSADSVFQVAAHEEVIPVEELYRICREARELLQGAHGVGRVIARPFRGSPGNFWRTEGRRDFSLPPPGRTLLDAVREAGQTVVGIGKIEDIFAGRGLTRSLHSGNNREGVAYLLEALRQRQPGLVMANLVDFDMLYGHRNDPKGYAAALEEFDACLPQIMGSLHGEDVLVITADHGNDPTTPSTDHSREYVPLLVYSPVVRRVALGTRRSMADLGATVAAILGVPPLDHGESFAGAILGGIR